MRVRWLRGALRNLEEEAAFIAADDAAGARLVVRCVLEAVEQLVEQPALGRPGRVPGTRELVVARTRYLVPYRVKRDSIEILRVFHTSRRMPARW
jgi:plasmid stabilization system protein ParE